MRILRLSTPSLILAIAVITLGLAAAPALANPADENGCHDHKDCGGDDTTGTLYTAALEGAFVFGPRSVTLEGQDERLKSSDPVTVAPVDTDFLTTWNNVFEFCNLLDQPVDEFTAPAGKKGWRISRPGGVYVLFRNFGPLGSSIGDLDVSLQLNGECSYSSDGPIDCAPFPPGEGQESRIPLTHFIIHASGEKGITHQIEGCHTISANLLQDNSSTLVITAEAPTP